MLSCNSVYYDQMQIENGTGQRRLKALVAANVFVIKSAAAL
jgi:hypothetical protein